MIVSNPFQHNKQRWQHVIKLIINPSLRSSYFYSAISSLFCFFPALMRGLFFAESYHGIHEAPLSSDVTCRKPVLGFENSHGRTKSVCSKYIPLKKYMINYLLHYN